MLHKRLIPIFGSMALTVSVTKTADATCNLPNQQYLDIVASFDSHYQNIGLPVWNSGSTTGSAYCCDQNWMNMVWDRWTFGAGTWDGPMGRTDACNSFKPVARVFHGLYALLYSAPQFAQTWGDTSTGTVLNWGGTWSARWIVALSGTCAFGVSYTAATYDTHTEITLNVPYIETVPERSSTLLHESVHAYGVNHDGPNNKDKKWNSGPWTYQTEWLFEYAANGVRNTEAMRHRAADRGSWIQNNWFVTKPFFAIFYRKADGADQNVDCSNGCPFNTGNDLFLDDWDFVQNTQ